MATRQMQRLFGQNQLALPGLPQSVKLALMADVDLRAPVQQLGAVEHRAASGRVLADDGGAEDSGREAGGVTMAATIMVIVSTVKRTVEGEYAPSAVRQTG